MLRSVRSSIRKARKRSSRLEVAALRFLWGARPIPLAVWEARQAVLARVLPIKNVGRPSSTSDRSVLPEEVRALVEDLPVGGWALEPLALRYLVDEFEKERPRIVVEFGSGTSTVVFGHLASRTTGSVKPTVLSFEQGQEGADRIRQALSARAITGAVITHLPLNADDEYDPAGLAAALRELERAVDWVVIDGPYGPSGCREGTLPSVLEACANGARWFLDDALRTAELGFLRRWSERTGSVRITVDGIIPVGQGLATGRVWR